MDYYIVRSLNADTWFCFAVRKKKYINHDGGGDSVFGRDFAYVLLCHIVMWSHDPPLSNEP